MFLSVDIHTLLISPIEWYMWIMYMFDAMSTNPRTTPSIFIRMSRHWIVKYRVIFNSH